MNITNIPWAAMQAEEDRHGGNQFSAEFIHWLKTDVDRPINTPMNLEEILLMRWAWDRAFSAGYDAAIKMVAEGA